MMQKKMWFRALCLMLICGIILSSFSGCFALWATQMTEEDELETIRDDLNGYLCCGLKVYLSDDFSEEMNTGAGAYFTADDIEVYVQGTWAEEIDEDISSAKDALEYYADSLDEEYDSGKRNGVRYLQYSYDGFDYITGFYYKSGYVWTVMVRVEDSDLLEDAIRYATVAQIKHVPEKDVTTSSTALIRPVEPDEPAAQEITLSVWTSEGDQGKGGWLNDRLAAFEAAHPEYDITWEIGIVSEADAGNQVRADPSAAADVYMFANDQLGALYEAGALAKLGGTYLEQVMDANSETYLNTVTYIDGDVYGFPMTCNTWFMYYNKDTYSAEDIKSLDTMLEKGVVAMQMGTAWYSASFFMSNGCTLFGEHSYDASAGIDFGGQAGYDAAEAMIRYTSHPNFVDDTSGTGIAGMLNGSVDAMFSGSWDFSVLYNGFYDAGMAGKLGCAELPYLTIGGVQKQLTAFAGSKCIGVNPYCENQKAAMELAAFLSSKESQLKRFQMREITPAHKDLADSAFVNVNPVAAAEIAVMNNCSVAQPVIAEMAAFWSPMGTFGGSVMNGAIDLDNYKDQVDLLNNQLNFGGL